MNEVDCADDWGREHDSEETDGHRDHENANAYPTGGGHR